MRTKNITPLVGITGQQFTPTFAKKDATNLENVVFPELPKWQFRATMPKYEVVDALDVRSETFTVKEAYANPAFDYMGIPNSPLGLRAYSEFIKLVINGKSNSIVAKVNELIQAQKSREESFYYAVLETAIADCVLLEDLSYRSTDVLHYVKVLYYNYLWNAPLFLTAQYDNVVQQNIDTMKVLSDELSDVSAEDIFTLGLASFFQAIENTVYNSGYKKLEERNKDKYTNAIQGVVTFESYVLEICTLVFGKEQASKTFNKFIENAFGSPNYTNSNKNLNSGGETGDIPDSKAGLGNSGGSSRSMLLIGILILVGIYLLKKNEKGLVL